MGLANKTQLNPQPGAKSPVTALGFQQLPDQGTVLFVSTTACIASYNLSQNKKERIIDEGSGAGTGLACMTGTKGFAVAREEAVYFYGEEEQDGWGGQPEQGGCSGCFVFEGKKDLIGWCAGHLVVVSTAVRYAGAEPESSITVVDLANRLIAHAQPLPKPVTRLVTVWGSVLAFLSDGSLLRLTEKVGRRPTLQLARFRPLPACAVRVLRLPPRVPLCRLCRISG